MARPESTRGLKPAISECMGGSKAEIHPSPAKKPWVAMCRARWFGARSDTAASVASEPVRISAERPQSLAIRATSLAVAGQLVQLVQLGHRAVDCACSCSIRLVPYHAGCQHGLGVADCVMGSRLQVGVP